MTSTPKSHPNETFQYIHVKDGYVQACKDAQALVKIDTKLIFGGTIRSEFYIKGADWKSANMHKAEKIDLFGYTVTAYNKKGVVIGSLKVCDKSPIPF